VNKTASFVLASATVVSGTVLWLVIPGGGTAGDSSTVSRERSTRAPVRPQVTDGRAPVIPTPGAVPTITVPDLSTAPDSRPTLSIGRLNPDAAEENVVPIPVPETPAVSREELLARAQAVQKATERKLQKLATDLDLTDDQQDYLFGVIAQTSSQYHPALQVGVVGTSPNGNQTASEFRPIETAAAPGTPGSPGRTSSQRTVDDLVFDVLAEDQAEILTEQILERDQWWTDIIQLLEQDLENSTTGDVIAAQPNPAPGEDAGKTPAAGSAGSGSAPLPGGQPRESTSESLGGGSLKDLLGGSD
jgi:hypothetical protein